MSISSFRRRFVGAALGAVAVLGIGVAGAYATGLIGQDSTINACVDNSTGIVRVVQHVGACSSTEHPLSWSQQAPGGPPGATRTAYAHFTGGALDASRSNGIRGWIRYGDFPTATYCLTILSFVPKNITTSSGLITSTSLASLALGSPPAVALQGETAMKRTPCPDASAAVRVNEDQRIGFADFYVSLSS